ncbi:MAG: hypothetical protein OEV43_07055, partial [Coriobacteriia bacterium]|nr:hypothetical protein [Coriobacteriia bacterium]
LLYGLFITVAVLSAPIAFAKHEKPDRLVLAGFWAAAAGYLVALTFGISVTGSSFLLWLSMAVVLSPLATTREVKPPSWGVAAAGIGLALVVVLSIGNVVYIVADNHYLNARLLGRDKGDERIAEAEQAVKLNPYNDMYRAEVGLANVDMVVAYYARLGSAQSQAELDAMTAQALRYFNKAETALVETIDFVPSEYDNYVFATNLYTLGAELQRASGNAAVAVQMDEKAVEIGRRGVDVEPFGPAIRFQLSRALISRDMLDEALEHMEFAVEMDPEYIDGLILLGDIYRSLQRPEDAIDAYKRAQALVSATGGTRPGIEESIKALEAEIERSSATTAPTPPTTGGSQ